MAPGGSLSRKREDVTIKRRVKIFRQEATHKENFCVTHLSSYSSHIHLREGLDIFFGAYIFQAKHILSVRALCQLSPRNGKMKLKKPVKKAEAHLIRVEDWLQSLRKMWHPLYVVPGIFWSVLHNSGSCLVDGTRNGGLQRGRSLQQNKCSQFSYVVVDYSGQKAVMKELFGVCSLCRALVILKNIFRYISSILPL